jgi:hypothetical protein
MRRLILAATACLVLLAAPASAQGPVEAGGFFGWTAVDGETFPPPTASGAAYTQARPRNGGSYGFTLGLWCSPTIELEFLWDRQPTTLDVTGTGPALSGRLNIDNYHGQLLYHFRSDEDAARPFVAGGFGATHYSDVALSRGHVPGQTRFSWMFGGGLKVYPSRRVGLRAMVRFVPTYLDPGETGLRCDLSLDCWANSNAANSIQVEFSGGVLIRF